MPRAGMSPHEDSSVFANRKTRRHASRLAKHAFYLITRLLVLPERLLPWWAIVSLPAGVGLSSARLPALLPLAVDRVTPSSSLGTVLGHA